MSAIPSSPASLAATDADFPPSTIVSSPLATDAAVCIYLLGSHGDLIIAGFGIQDWEESSVDDQEAGEKVCYQDPSLSPTPNNPPRNQRMTSIAGLAWNFC